MAKGDYVKIRSEIGGQLTEDRVDVVQDGGQIEVDWSERAKGMIHVKLMGRTGKLKQRFTYALIAVRSIESKVEEDE
ncbi:MAG TPA: hypothetical protein VFX15_02730 [Actinomycetes bacterium]|nr:hypothetical protein [Actinomycetes bacterium]